MPTDAPEYQLLHIAQVRATELLHQHGLYLPKEQQHQSYNVFGIVKAPCRDAVKLVMGPATVRIAFSNTAFWRCLSKDIFAAAHAAQEPLGLFGVAPDHIPHVLTSKGNKMPSVENVGPNPKSVAHSSPGISYARDASQVTTQSPARTAGKPEFQRRILDVDVQLEPFSLLLCDDRPQSFGAPDILQVLSHSREMSFA